MSETIVRFKAAFTKARATKATAAPTLATGRETPKIGASVATMPPKATRRNVGRAARQLALAHLIERKVEAGELKDFAAAAKVLQVSRARLSQIVNLLNLAPDIQEQILLGDLRMSERRLRATHRERNWEAQRKLLLPGSGSSPFLQSPAYR